MERLLFTGSLSFFVFLAACAGIASSVAPSANCVKVEGLVSHNARSYPGATVNFHRLKDFSTAASPALTALSGEKGHFEAFIPPGDYMVTATAPGLFAYFGRNPIRVGADQRGLSLPLSAAHIPRIDGAEAGGEEIVGVVRLGGKPVPGIVVQAYLDARKGFKGPPYAASAPTGEDGTYLIPLEPGSYHLVAKRRAASATTGPLEAGDLFGAFPELPVTVAAKTKVNADIEVVRLPDAYMMSRYLTAFTVFSGRIVDREGRPVKGFRPCLYDNPRMIDEPLSVGEPTGGDGLFTIRTSRSGSVWLGAREKLGGPPAPGERIGFPEKYASEGFTLTPGGRYDDIIIIVRQVLN